MMEAAAAKPQHGDVSEERVERPVLNVKLNFVLKAVVVCPLQPCLLRAGTLSALVLKSTTARSTAEVPGRRVNPLPLLRESQETSRSQTSKFSDEV